MNHVNNVCLGQPLSENSGDFSVLAGSGHSSFSLKTDASSVSHMEKWQLRNSAQSF